MDQEWNESIADNYNVIVFLIQRSTNISTLASADPDSPAMDKDKTRKKTRLLNPEKEEQNVGALHINSSQLRHCSKYFDTCLAKKWAQTKIIMSKTPVHLTLDVYTDVEYYKDCFSRMYSSQYMQIPSVSYCLKLLQVASQIRYLKLVEDCICYLTSIPWSHEDEKKIRQFANSIFYPSDCAADLSARLDLALNNNERHVFLLDNTKQAFCQCFDDFLRADFFNVHCEEVYCRKELISTIIELIVSTPSQFVVENVLQYINVCVKQLILAAKEQSPPNKGFKNASWTLNLLLDARLAEGLVEYIVDESPLCKMLKTSHATWRFEWINNISLLFYKVVEGHLLLKTSTRYKLIKDWTWVLLINKKFDKDKDLEKNKVFKLLSTFVTTFPYEMQKEIISNWTAYYMDPSQKMYNLLFRKIQKDWFESLEKKIVHLNYNNQPQIDRP